jgi:hypothetical protein
MIKNKKNFIEGHSDINRQKQGEEDTVVIESMITVAF